MQSKRWRLLLVMAGIAWSVYRIGQHGAAAGLVPWLVLTICTLVTLLCYVPLLGLRRGWEVTCELETHTIEDGGRLSGVLHIRLPRALPLMWLTLEEGITLRDGRQWLEQGWQPEAPLSAEEQRTAQRMAAGTTGTYITELQAADSQAAYTQVASQAADSQVAYTQAADSQVAYTQAAHRHKPSNIRADEQFILTHLDPQDEQLLLLPLGAVLLPWFKRRYTVPFAVQGLRRGALRLTQVRVTAGDLLGFARRQIALPCVQDVLVTPASPQQSVRSMTEQTAHVVSTAQSAGQPAAPGTRPAAQGEEPVLPVQPRVQERRQALQAGSGAELRRYMPGDPLRRVHWQSLARGGTMQTRVDNPAERAELLLVLDCHAAQLPRMFDAAVGEALARVLHAVRQGDLVTLRCGELVWRTLGGQQRQPKVQDVRFAARQLARMVPSDPVPLPERVRELLRQENVHGTVLLVTSYTGAWSTMRPALGDLIEKSTRRGIRVQVILLIPAAEAPRSMLATPHEPVSRSITQNSQQVQYIRVDERYLQQEIVVQTLGR